jgi:hypothetical protein
MHVKSIARDLICNIPFRRRSRRQRAIDAIVASSIVTCKLIARTRLRACSKSNRLTLSSYVRVVVTIVIAIVASREEHASSRAHVYRMHEPPPLTSSSISHDVVVVVTRVIAIVACSKDLPRTHVDRRACNMHQPLGTDVTSASSSQVWLQSSPAAKICLARMSIACMSRSATTSATGAYRCAPSAECSVVCEVHIDREICYERLSPRILT